jgi:hypothetical protein
MQKKEGVPMTLTAFNGSFSFVFLEAALRPNAVGLDPSLPREVWNEAIRNSSVKNFAEFHDIDVAKTKGAVARAGSEELTLSSGDDGSYKAYAASFNKAADAKTFYEELDRLLAARGAQHALRETARLNEGGKIQVVGYQP